MATPGTISPDPDVNLLFVDTDDAIGAYRSHLGQFRLDSTSRVAVATELIRRTSPALVITELELEDGTGVEVCRTAKALRVPATVLVTTAHTGAVPDALATGCDGVLLKPFAPNLLVARIGRLLRDRSNRVRLAAARAMHKSAHLAERMELLRGGTNRVWPDTHCPYCGHAGATSFDFASMRRAWYACLECRKVWMAKRRE
jgi:DNA-binding response OmpR family regulator